MKLAERLADTLGSVPGVVAIVLGGSRARGAARPDSDLDLGIYYHPDRPPSIQTLRDIARELDDRHTGDAVTDFGEWGPWINGGAWLQIKGQKVDWLYRNLAQVTGSVEESRQGRIAVHYQPGHPCGFPTYLYMGEINICLPLHDPQGAIAALKALTEPYPAALERAIVDRFLWEAGFALETARTSADRGDVSYLAGCLFRSACCLVQVLFALNEQYCINEKGSVAATESMAVRPLDFRSTLEEVLGRPGTSPPELRRSLQRMEGMVRAVQNLAPIK
jgi:predicted nucleotidyltransferase